MPWNDYRKVDIRGLRIGVWTGEKNLEASPDTRSTIDRAAKTLAQTGAIVECMISPYAPYDLEEFAEILLAVVCTAGQESLPKAAAEMGANEDRLVADCVHYTRERLAKTPKERIDPLQAELPKLRRAVLRNIQRYDAMLWPVCRSPAPLHGTSWWKAFHDYEYLCNSLSGLVWTLPEGAVRCGTSSEGLPIGVQVIGAPYREDVVLQVMQTLERELGGWQPPPASVD